jgi:hypothetical protein
VIIDPTAAARRPDPERAREWLAEQRVFISSAMGDTAAERQAVATAVEAEGAQPVWFEELGRDADSEEAYLAGVDGSTIYVGILNEQYGRLLATGFSATEAEYLRARERGKRVAVYTAADAPGREGHLNRFIERVRTFVTTESYRDIADLDHRVRRRLHELAAEALSPWVKLGDSAFRADLIADHGETVTITARLNDEIAHAFEAMRDRQWGRPRLKLTYGTRIVEGDVGAVRRTVRAGGTDQIEIELARVQPPQVEVMRAGTSGLSADELVEAGMRTLPRRAPATLTRHARLHDRHGHRWRRPAPGVRTAERDRRSDRALGRDRGPGRFRTRSPHCLVHCRPARRQRTPSGNRMGRPARVHER